MIVGSTQVEMSLADPLGSSVVVAATGWVQGTLLGTLATIIAVIAVAVVGLLMLSGRVDARRGLTVLIGCFVLFGAPVIANGLRAVSGDVVVQNLDRDLHSKQPKFALPPAPQPRPDTYDPYAGAAVQR